MFSKILASSGYSIIRVLIKFMYVSSCIDSDCTTSETAEGNFSKFVILEENNLDGSNECHDEAEDLSDEDPSQFTNSQERNSDEEKVKFPTFCSQEQRKDECFTPGS